MKLDPYREYAEPPRAVDSNWIAALEKPISIAAEGAEHDLQRAAHRPGGGIKPRPRFSADEKNRFGQF